MNYLKTARSAVSSGRYNHAFVAAILVATAGIVLTPDVALANPFAGAEAGARQFRDSLKSFALVVGGIGVVSCLLLGFFGKLNWKWVATAVGVSFSLAIVPRAIDWLDSLSGS